MSKEKVELVRRAYELFNRYQQAKVRARSTVWLQTPMDPTDPGANLGVRISAGRSIE
jgi:hypothetical protein